MLTYDNYGKFLDTKYKCLGLYGQNQSHREYSICYLPVCVDLICMVEQVEPGNVTGGSSLDGFLLDKC